MRQILIDVVCRIPKVDSARRTLLSQSDVKGQNVSIHLGCFEHCDIMQEYDVIVSGSDNFTTAYMVNDAAVLLKNRVVYGSICGSMAKRQRLFPMSPCYRCLYPKRLLQSGTKLR